MNIRVQRSNTNANRLFGTSLDSEPVRPDHVLAIYTGRQKVRAEADWGGGGEGESKKKVGV